jgi:hypothetical protein
MRGGGGGWGDFQEGGKTFLWGKEDSEGGVVGGSAGTWSERYITNYLRPRWVAGRICRLGTIWTCQKQIPHSSRNAYCTLVSGRRKPKCRCSRPSKLARPFDSPPDPRSICASHLASPLSSSPTCSCFCSCSSPSAPLLTTSSRLSVHQYPSHHPLPAHCPSTAHATPHLHPAAKTAAPPRSSDTPSQLRNTRVKHHEVLVPLLVPLLVGKREVAPVRGGVDVGRQHGRWGGAEGGGEGSGEGEISGRLVGEARDVGFAAWFDLVGRC